MKNIIIGGTVRSGKTTLANLIREKYGYSKVESDTIVNAFDQVFPEFGITHKNAELAREKYEPFLFEILNGFCRDLKYAGNITVFPGSQFLPENLSRYGKQDRYIIIFLGLGEATPEQLVNKIRECDTENDWTHKKTDEWLLRFAKNVIDESVRIEQDCRKYGYYYFDTFQDREITLNKICDLILDLQS